MKLEILRNELDALLVKQIGNLFLITKDEEIILTNAITTALERADYCFSHYNSKYYRKDGETYFNPFHSGQYAIFLYYVSRELFLTFPNYRTLADRVYYLNKMLNCVDLFYEVSLSTIFNADHPVGSVMGRASYSDFFTFAQNCSVGNNKGFYPIIGKNVLMAAGATLLGKCTIGENVIISAHTYIKDTDIPPCSVVFGSYPNLTIKQKDVLYFRNPFMKYNGFNGWD